MYTPSTQQILCPGVAGGGGGRPAIAIEDDKGRDQSRVEPLKHTCMHYNTYIGCDALLEISSPSAHIMHTVCAYYATHSLTPHTHNMSDHR